MGAREEDYVVIENEQVTFSYLYLSSVGVKISTSLYLASHCSKGTEKKQTLANHYNQGRRSQVKIVQFVGAQNGGGREEND